MANTKKHSKKKEDDGEAEEKHCICDSKDYSTLMICCDYCLIWYHVECVKVTETQAKIFKKFACHFCTAKDPSCVTLHKKWAKGVVMSKHRGTKSGGSAKNKESNAGKEKKHERETKSGGTEKRRRERERSGESSSKTAGGGTRKSNRTKTDGEESEETRRATPEANAVPPTVPPPMTAQQKHQLELQVANPNLRCKNCIGCFREKNCGKCFTCCAATTTTTSDDARCCTARICVQVEELLKQQQQQKMPSSSSAAVDGKTSEETEGEENGGEKRTTAQQMAGARGERRGGSSKKKGRKPKADKRHRQNQTTAQQQQQRKHHRHGGHGTMTAEEQQQATNVQLLRAYENLLRRRQNNANGGGVEGGGTSSRGNRIAQEDLHCHGPGCTNSARVGSKYCSENCGIELAKLRLRLILPQRFNAFFGEAPHTQTENNAHIERIQEQMADINIRLDELDQWKNNVHQFMVVLKSNTFVDNGTTIAMDNDGIAMEQQSTTTTTKRSPNGSADANRDDGDGGKNDCHAAENGSEEKKPTMMTTTVAAVKNEDENMLVGCPVCHGEFQMREICKHVHTCFVRSERQTTYGTDYQIPNNQYNLYCEAYNKIDGTFCKRLRYACAEHYRDEYGLEVCGCPLGWYKGNSLEFRAMFAASSQQQEEEEKEEGEGNASALSFGDEGFCRQKQKNCRDHKNWAQTAFSLIDNERLNLLNKFDELCEQRRHLQLKLLQRGDILSLFCNNSEPSSSTPITN